METRFVERTNQKFPRLLKQIPDPPAHLYFKGAWEESLFENCLAVVGSRHMTTYGRRAIEQIVGEVAGAGVTIVSGFMFGIDEAAHQAALDGGGRTIAVMPCGIERVHPAYQEELYKRILEEEGLVLSEYEGDLMPQYWMYPKRNRIVAGLCKATLVVEAGLGSGSLITANLAKKFARKVFAVPGPITSEVSQGTAKLLREGAAVAASADDVLEFFDRKALFSRRQSGDSDSPGDRMEQKILEILRREPLGPDLLARELRLQAAELGTILSLLELQGVIKQEGGKYYAH